MPPSERALPPSYGILHVKETLHPPETKSLLSESLTPPFESIPKAFREHVEGNMLLSEDVTPPSEGMP